MNANKKSVNLANNIETNVKICRVSGINEPKYLTMTAHEVSNIIKPRL